jgi:hypothetical protein
VSRVSADEREDREDLTDDRDDAEMPTLRNRQEEELSCLRQDTILLSHCGIVRLSESLASYRLYTITETPVATYILHLHLELVCYSKLQV